MDQLTYHYKTGTNQLDHVTDLVPAANYSIDIDNQQVLNYTYDQIGNLTKDVAEGIAQIDWTVYGKIARIQKSNGTVITYTYDAGGNRISKSVNGKETWYVRDASGNVMATYLAESGSFTQTEVHLYGSSRLGVLNCAVNCGNLVPTAESVLERGNKFFELSNHLGNVLVTVTDRLVPHSTDGTSIAYNAADVSSAQDYYSFGMAMPGRGFSSGSYRYGFNGKENDKDIGEGGQDYGMRINDSRLGRFLSVDPLCKNYAPLTPYQFASNSPIAGIDLDGGEFNYFMTRQIWKIVEKKVELSHTNGVEIPASLKAQQFVMGMHKNLSLEGLVYELEKSITHSPDKTIEFSDLPKQVKSELVQNSIDKSSAFGMVSIAKNFWGTGKAAFNGDWEAAGNLAALALTLGRGVYKLKTSVNLKQVSLRNVMEGADDWRMIYYKKINIGDVIRTSIESAELDIIVPKNLQGNGILSEVYRRLIKIWNPETINSTWKYDPVKYKDYGGVSTNLKVFLENRSLGDNAAAFATPSGKAAKANGFTNVKVTVTQEAGKVTSVNAIFSK